MYLTTAPPLLFALGIRLFLNAINPDHKDSTADHLLQGLWQGVLLYHVLKHTTWAVFPVGFAIAAKLLYDFASNFDTTRCACVLLGAALGVLCTDLITQLFEEGRYNEVQPRSPATTVALQASSRETSSRRQRVVSFEHGIDRDRPSRRHKSSADRARANASSPAPTNAHSISTALTLDSLPSSIDPLGRMPPAEREIAVLRARASLADSERRRFKEERKWALSQGNIARADQLDWQVKRYSTLMDSYHREADAKVVEGSLSAHHFCSVHANSQDVRSCASESAAHSCPSSCPGYAALPDNLFSTFASAGPRPDKYVKRYTTGQRHTGWCRPITLPQEEWRW